MARVEYWLQIENQTWDVMPNGMDRTTGAALARDANGFFRPLPQQALIVRRYTEYWTAPDDRVLNAWDVNEADPTQTRGTIPGATIEAKVGDEIIVHFRNMDQRTGVPDAERVHSLHAHGLTHSPMYDGMYPFSPPDPQQGNKRGDRLVPGESFDYRYTVMHASNAGAWLYHDHSIAHHASVALGAFGAIVVRGGGEGKPQLPMQPLRAPGDTPIHFANLPQPASATDHLFVLHELAGVGVCWNGRQGLGNTPSVLARSNGRVKFRVLNLTDCAQSFHLHGHRWQSGGEWVDSELVPSGGGITFDLLEGTSENGGGGGEWAFMSHNVHGLVGSLIVADGGPLTLTVGSGMTMPGDPHAGHHH